ncbi:MAG: glucokinase [Kiloniellaceae bacterium]
MAAATAPGLLVDIGGTNARFALAGAGGIGHETRLAVADYPGPVEALRAFLERTGPAPPPRRAALAVAGPVQGDSARLTNSPWKVAAADLRAAFGFERITLVNDFAAVAWAVPRLAAHDLVKIGGGQARPSAPAAVIGPGTGLGVAGLVPAEDGPLVLVSEGGHVTMAPADAREDRILDRLRRGFGHVSAERVLSGGGLVNLYEALAELDGSTAPPRTAAEIAAQALAGDCPMSAAALQAFCAMLGTVAGNLALTLGAGAGVYIAGGIVPRFPEYLEASNFRARFEAKGRFRDYLAAIPTWVVVHPDPAFLGLAGLLERDIKAV